MATKKKAAAQKDHFFRVGAAYLIRTVTHYHVGRVVSVTPAELVLADAAWVADTGRFATAIRTGTLNETEPFVGDVLVNRAAIIDATEWSGKLPAEQK